MSGSGYRRSESGAAFSWEGRLCQDCEDGNPLIRALAVRTMGCIRVDKITEYLCEPLRKCLKDEDPYVRKTAAVCVAKLHDINAPLVEDQGFLDQLRDLLSDSNPMVSGPVRLLFTPKLVCDETCVFVGPIVRLSLQDRIPAQRAW